MEFILLDMDISLKKRNLRMGTMLPVSLLSHHTREKETQIFQTNQFLIQGWLFFMKKVCIFPLKILLFFFNSAQTYLQYGKKMIFEQYVCNKQRDKNTIADHNNTKNMQKLKNFITIFRIRDIFIALIIFYIQSFVITRLD